MPNFYCLLLPQATRTAVNCLRTELFQSTGDRSFRSLPPCIILGETEATTLPPAVPCPSLPFEIGKKAIFKEGFLFFPIEGHILQPIRNQLEVSYPFSGIILGKSDLQIERAIPFVNDLRLALLEYKESQGLTLWRILAEKHLQKDKG
ncbi:hypothetical protein SpiGrapes_0035 [Sphaerochaeta pleomorpha str. Grapes]|uniref:Uncharacterized protein n=1 Tax=Sphaerochaeta pleomorpha (strain ATCC BAA-1885 / DSM 22778 / Grapes) TaxID=158190 RepID=G8QSZ4_SPHPG|nr:hypothetical protein [Sphaerochaeta pleomorpha]AEV27899.1 hypothetical protein SpiGrapes_0035 [Sphaerochaeta pleomorpha str. Grapes]